MRAKLSFFGKTMIILALSCTHSHLETAQYNHSLIC